MDLVLDLNVQKPISMDPNPDSKSRESRKGSIPTPLGIGDFGYSNTHLQIATLSRIRSCTLRIIHIR